MEGTMKTAVMTGISQVEIQERPIPVPADNEVLVKVEYVGICGSDLHYYESGRIGDFVVEPPFVLGHEAGGTVVETGAGVTDLKVGDRVALDVINIAFGQVRDACMVWDGQACRPALERIRKIKPGIKILLSAGGWGADGFGTGRPRSEERRVGKEC